MPVSQTLPLREEPYVSRSLHPFFDNLLPEGWLLELSTAKLKIPKDDAFGILLATCADCVGAVEILPLEERAAVSVCLACLRPSPDAVDYHRRCLQRLFGRPVLPRLEIDMQHLHTVGLELAGRVAISGVQRKLALRLSAGSHDARGRPHRRAASSSSPRRRPFPPFQRTSTSPMRLAELAGIPVPPCALVALADGALAFLVLRFDRSETGRKYRMEDFCQLSEKPSKDRYVGSAEQCARRRRPLSPPTRSSSSSSSSAASSSAGGWPMATST